MKKLLMIAMVALMLPLMPAQARKFNYSQVSELIWEYKSNQDFNVVNVGGLGLSLMRAAVRSEGNDEDARIALSFLKSVKHITVVEYDSCEQSLRDEFTAKLDAVLNGCDMLMDVHDEDSQMTVYGTMTKDGETLKNLVLYAPKDSAVICIEGNLNVKDLSYIVEDAKKKNK